MFPGFRITGKPVEAWVVWNGQPRGEGDLTLAFADEAWGRALLVREVVTLSADGPAGPPENDKTCFVVMPFGTKPVDGRDVAFDAIFSTILGPAIAAVKLPENGNVRPYRTDKDLAADMIDQDMFERLEYSRFVFCDLTGLRPAEIAMVGDNGHDLELARAAGCGLAVGVLSGTGTRASLSPLADVILTSAIELPGILTERNAA